MVLFSNFSSPEYIMDLQDKHWLRHSRGSAWKFIYNSEKHLIET